LADRFVGMYVNDDTLDYGERGRAGIEELFRRAEKANLLNTMTVDGERCTVNGKTNRKP